MAGTKEQEQALQFYTGILGFKVKNDIPMGEHRWLTVVSPHEPDGTELVLEPMAFEPARVYQAKLFEDGMIQIRRIPPFMCSC